MEGGVPAARPSLNHLMKSKAFLSALLLAAAFSACKPDPKTQIIGLWQEVGIKNPQIDEAMEQQRQFLDTVGLHSDSATNARMYGFASIDTFKKSIRTNLDSFKRAQGKAIRETWFDFHKDGLVYLHSQEGLDSARWYFEEDGALMLDEQDLKGGGAKIRMTVEALNDTALRLNHKEQYLNSTADFRRVKR